MESGTKETLLDKVRAKFDPGCIEVECEEIGLCTGRLAARIDSGNISQQEAEWIAESRARRLATFCEPGKACGAIVLGKSLVMIPGQKRPETL